MHSSNNGSPNYVGDNKKGHGRMELEIVEEKQKSPVTIFAKQFTNDKAVCVKPESKIKLIERGWAKDFS